jgi:hypothetical protein
MGGRVTIGDGADGGAVVAFTLPVFTELAADPVLEGPAGRAAAARPAPSA